ncbi:MAG: S8 family serine peptidase [Chloroflexi bacterium]|nr:S8 family serine peptidase [Chloroflexota bacterium]
MQAAAPQVEYVPGQLLVKLKPGNQFVPGAGEVGSDSVALTSLLVRYSVTSVESIDIGSSTYLLHLGTETPIPEVATSFQSLDEVEFAEPNYRLQATLVPNDPYFQSFQWGLTQIQADRAWDITTGSADVTIAVLDTGVARDHPDLAGKVLPGHDFVNDDADAADDNGHGTYTAGIAAANSNNHLGVCGVSWGARILPVKILNQDGAGSVDAFARGIRYAADQGARIINVSAGMPIASQVMADAVNYAYGKGSFLVAAAGNTPDGQPNYPAAFEKVTAVGATGRNDASTGFSSFGPYLGVVAPGIGIISTFWNFGELTYDSANGTSASAPFVAGLAGLLLSLKPDLSNNQIKQIIEATSDDQGPAGWDEHYGFGRVNAYKAVLTVAQGSTGNPVAGQSKILGTIHGAPPDSVVVLLQPGPQMRPDAQGRFEFSHLPDGTYTVTAVAAGFNLVSGPEIVTVNGEATDVKQVDLSFAPAVNPAFARVAPIADNVDRRYFPQSSHTLSYGFKAYWESNGGLPIFGLPISEEFQENGFVTQYFERARFEYHPEFAGTPFEVSLGLLGRQITTDRTFSTVQSFTSSADRVFFPETGHSLSSGFLRYWRQSGDLAIYGFPISEEVSENGRTVQYFERARFEYHPELPPEYSVSLGLLGLEVASKNGWL